MEGSIVKIVLRNFVTYDYCEFTPGPQLNMIIGPNGTGKSTIVCAVALGLGGSPLLLGRARNIADFVKTGESNASIQIELKKVTGPNAVIQRNINKANNASSWKYNGTYGYLGTYHLLILLLLLIRSTCLQQGYHECHQFFEHSSRQPLVSILPYIDCGSWSFPFITFL